MTAIVPISYYVNSSIKSVTLFWVLQRIFKLFSASVNRWRTSWSGLTEVIIFMKRGLILDICSGHGFYNRANVKETICVAPIAAISYLCLADKSSKNLKSCSLFGYFRGVHIIYSLSSSMDHTLIKTNWIIINVLNKYWHELDTCGGYGLYL